METTNTRVALVTGGSGGIGRVTSERLARDGMAVAVHYAGNEARANEVVGEITAAGGRAITVGGDVADEHRHPDGTDDGVADGAPDEHRHAEPGAEGEADDRADRLTLLGVAGEAASLLLAVLDATRHQHGASTSGWVAKGASCGATGDSPAQPLGVWGRSPQEKRRRGLRPRGRMSAAAGRSAELARTE